jgi:hypothetical protein
VGVAPLRHRGLRGKKSTPSIGWEVPVKYHRWASGSCTECAERLREDNLGYGTHALILHGRLLLNLLFHFNTFNYVKKVFDVAI